MKTIILIIFSILTLSSCSDFTDQDHYYVDPRLQYFVDKFYKEAELRGVHINKHDIEIVVGQTTKQGYTDYSKHQIAINESMIKAGLGHSYNDAADSLEIEYVIVHECSHWFLKRGHLPDSVFTIMTPNDEHIVAYQRDSIARRALIEELFSQSTTQSHRD